ncbi:hypothetical protein NEUTE1DRAFT_102725 [Neurospora tetrasperma FGSC 2508]|uniref:Uncharacterized protein n=1 Tax=Neurospora tetrasperma (strain FGSC 2508 / ATCC MYA-4615 / P0657) TaxID=510951 RepID=F8MTG1_NEUT8|nr:uncharacterized protein NEUTE1DRAFT_102725 [Neurospora tetrasperma FGSC 2508]EGO55293.1 hypothetical protein NEUTE1DRAFT_102725 [Neurospora tetrasperma FGSC 2508]EGZ69485.1 hypothetical protein NEUTE2DRAFT_71119 [Neurospora tetrasperma FGSC 2509]
MCTFCYTPYIGCPKGRRHYYLQWLKCKTAIKNGHSYCPIGESTEVRELQKLSGNVLACPFHTHIAIQQIEFEFRQRDEVPSPIDLSEPSSPTTSNTTYVASDDESEIEFNQAGQKSLHRPSSTAVYLDLRFPKPGPIKRHKSATPTKTQTTNIQQSTDRSLNSQSEPNTASICAKSVPGTSSSSSSSSKKGPVISPGLPASPAAYRQSRSQPQTQPHAKLTLKALTEVDESNKELRSTNKLSEPAYHPPSPPPPEIITTLPTPVDQANPSNPDLLTRRLGPSTALTITITKAPKLNIQKITSSKSEPDLKSTPKGLESSNSTTTSTSHTFDSFLTPSGTLQPKSSTTNSSTTTTNTTTTSSSSLRSRSGSLFTRLKDGTTTTLHHSALSRTLSASTTSTNRRRQASATHPKNIAPWDQVLLPASISKPVNLEVGVNDIATREPTNLAADGITNCALSSETKAIDGYLQGRLGGQGPRTAPLPAEMEVMMSRLESVGVGVGLGIGLAVTRDTDEGKSVSGHKRSCSANMLQGRMGIGLSGLRKRGECS